MGKTKQENENHFHDRTFGDVSETNKVGDTSVRFSMIKMEQIKVVALITRNLTYFFSHY